MWRRAWVQEAMRLSSAGEQRAGHMDCIPGRGNFESRNLRDETGRTYAVEVGRYFEEGLRTDVWLFRSASPDEQGAYPPFEISSVHRTLSSWLNLLLAAGFSLEYVGEPRPSEEVAAQEPRVADAQVVSYFLHLRARLLGSKR